MTSQVDCISDPHPDFMPWWTKAKQTFGKDMSSHVKLDNQEHDLTEGSCCFLGEVYGWSDIWQQEFTGWFKTKPKCQVCYKWGMNDFVAAEKMSVEEFYIWKSMIYEHVKQNHSKLVRKIK